MKLVKEHIILEKFTEDDSDPIADMGIGMMHQIKEWMKSKNINVIGKNDSLRWCAEYGKTEFVRYLLDAGADVHANNDDALINASENGYAEVVKLLLDAGADVHADNDEALRWASYYGHTEVVKLLLDAGADVHADNDKALRWASNDGYTEVVKLLLDVGADVHANDDEALRNTSYRGHTEVVKLLLDAGADVHAKNDYALRWASQNRHIEIVKLLKDHITKEKKSKKIIKESLNEKFTEESDPIDDLGIGIKNKLKKFIEHIRNVKYYLDEDSPELLPWAAYYNEFEIVEYLISKGYKFHFIKYEDTGDARNALTYAAVAGNIEMGLFLIERGADLNFAIKYAEKHCNYETQIGLQKIKRALENKI